jgi:arabinose-5-phosphate isomerase
MISNKIIIKIGSFPVLNQEAVIKDAIDVMNKYKLGSVCVVDKKNKLIGIITDGDIRRKLVKFQKPFPEFMNSEIKLICSKNPICVKNKSNLGTKKILKILNKNKIWDLPVVNSKKKLEGFIHLQNLIKLKLK